jgi:hypothetical protein
MAEIATEANCYQQSNGGTANEQALIQLLSSLQGPKWSSLLAIQNQA